MNLVLPQNNYEDNFSLCIPALCNEEKTKLQSIYNLSVDDLVDSIPLTNEEFIATAFANKTEQSLPLFHFVEDMHRWTLPTTDCNNSANLNAFYTVSSFIPNDEAVYRRVTEQFAALHVIALDDLVPEIHADKVTRCCTTA